MRFLTRKAIANYYRSPEGKAEAQAGRDLHLCDSARQWFAERGVSISVSRLTRMCREGQLKGKADKFGGYDWLIPERYLEEILPSLK